MLGEFYKKRFRQTLSQYALDIPYVVLVLAYFFVVWIPLHTNEWLVVWGFILGFLPFVLPVMLAILAVQMFLEYKREKQYWSTEHALLEIKLSEEITQGPYAAELLLRALYDTGEVDTPAHELLGNTRPWFSLELVSTEGVVRFYIWTRVKFKERIKAQIYAHYPTVQVVEVPDYTMSVPWDPEVYDLWGIAQCLQKPDPYPIATYIEQGMTKADMKEEFKNDPMVSLIEFFGSMGKGEHAWMQIIIRGHTECYWSEEEYHRHLKLNEWTDLEVKKLGEKFADKEGLPNYSRLPEGDKEAVKAMQNKLNKQIFDVGIRAMYIARKDQWKGNIRNNGFPTAFRSFEHGAGGIGLNGLKPIFYIGPFNVRWHDFMGIRRALLKKRMYRAYVTRQYFYLPYKDLHMALNSEEIATLYHFPGKVAHTPTLERMPSRRSEAPANLPI
ncbi:MAG: hypothetical protein Q7R71_00495 [bacterium]|nr:hypothetical protein [bacterium]